jgi:nickel-dependent lactate racemase
MADSPEQFDLAVGRDTWPLTVPAAKRVPFAVATPPTPGDPAALTRRALDEPFGLGATLGQAVTPDDRVAIVLDEGITGVAAVLTAVLEHLRAAGVEPGAVTVVTPPGGTNGAWLDDLPDELSDVTLEQHDPEDRKELAYLATTAGGRRVYLNRRLVEADFVAVVTRRGFDPTYGYSGAEVAIFPALSEPDALVEAVGKFTSKPPGVELPEITAAAGEVVWLLGMPFFVQVIPGPGDTIADVVGGLPPSREEGIRRLEAGWRGTVPETADLVIAALSGDPSRQTFDDLARAAAAAARVVTPGGRIAVVSGAAPTLDEGAMLVRRAEEPEEVRDMLRERKPDDWPAAALWCRAARTAGLFLASPWPDDVIEEFFATPLRTAAELQRLIDAAERVIVLPDAHKTMTDPPTPATIPFRRSRDE